MTLLLVCFLPGFLIVVKVLQVNKNDLFFFSIHVYSTVYLRKTTKINHSNNASINLTKSLESFFFPLISSASTPFSIYVYNINLHTLPVLFLIVYYVQYM